jgi:hypothetical protein
MGRFRWRCLRRPQPRATVELARTEGSQAAYRTETDEHGFYQFNAVSPGEYRLRISAPRFTVYETEIYIPSDFVGNLAVMLKPVRSDTMSMRKNKPAAQ